MDAEDIASWAKNAMELFTKTGSIKGSDNRLAPEETAARAQIAQILYSLLSK